MGKFHSAGLRGAAKEAEREVARLKEILQPRRKHKYRAKPAVIDGIKFPSTKQGQRYSQLRLLERAGQIKDLELEEPFDISINGVRCFRYRADFSYTENGKRVIEDVKGVRTPVYRLKKKCVEAAYGITIRET